MHFRLDVSTAFKLAVWNLRLDMAQVHLSTRPVGENATVGSDEAWEAATAALTEALDDVGLDYEVDEGEGAFYGKRLIVPATCLIRI
jgi:threonyl-tRNA synthetase